MRHFLAGLILILSFTILVPHTIADLILPPPPSVQDLVNKYALQYNVSPKKMMAIIKCENVELIPTLQSRIVKNGKREDSWGLVQIHLPDHPNITKQQATDAAFSIEFMAQQIKAGNAHIWTCARILHLT